MASMTLKATKKGDKIETKFKLPMGGFDAKDAERAGESMMKAINAQLEKSGSEWRLWPQQIRPTI